MREILDDLTRWLAAGEQVALATVVWAEGPSPRPLGSRMAVTASGKMAGSVSGGCVEGAVFEEAQTVLAGGPPKRLRFGVVDETGWEVGLACGGAIEVYVEPLVEVHRRLLAALTAEETVALATRLDDSSHLLAWPDGRLDGDCSLASELTALFSAPPRSPCPPRIGGAGEGKASPPPELVLSDVLSLSKGEAEGLGEGPGVGAELHHHPEGDVFLEVFTLPPTLVIVGAVHVAMPLVRLAQTMGFRVQVVDARRAFATRARFPTADELIVAWPQDALRAEELGPQHYVVVLSHDPKFDLPALRVALRSRAAYVGLLGSRTTQTKRKATLREEGFGEAELARIHGPVGLDLGGREPAEIALAILAEIVAVRHSRRGGMLGTQRNAPP